MVKGRKQQTGGDIFRNVEISGGCWIVYELLGFVLRGWLGFGKRKLDLGDVSFERASLKVDQFSD